MPIENRYDAELRAKAVIFSVTNIKQFEMARKFAIRALRLTYPIPKEAMSGSYFRRSISDPARDKVAEWISERNKQLAAEKKAYDVANNIPIDWHPERVERDEGYLWNWYECQKPKVNDVDVSVDVNFSVKGKLVV